MTDLADIFSATGRLAREVEGFRPRPFQLEMAEEIPIGKYYDIVEN